MPSRLLLARAIQAFSAVGGVLFVGTMLYYYWLGILVFCGITTLFITLLFLPWAVVWAFDEVDRQKSKKRNSASKN